jgi:hypothetical protein
MALLGSQTKFASASQQSVAAGLPKDLLALGSELSNSDRLNRSESLALSAHGATIIDAFGHTISGKPTEEGLLTNSVLEFAIKQMRSGNPFSVELLESLLALRETARLPERIGYPHAPEDKNEAEMLCLEFPKTDASSQETYSGPTEVVELKFPTPVEDTGANPLALYMSSDKAA